MASGTRRLAPAAIFSSILGFLTLCGCGTNAGPGASAGSVELFGAASTTNALGEVKALYQEEHGVAVQANYAASSTLAHQIENGAGADLFLSANEKWADYLDSEGLVARRRDLLANRLVIVVPADSQASIATPEDLNSEAIKRIALADPTAVPAGIYARQALVKLALWETLSEKIVSGDDVRRALFFVETGNAQAGIVYATDAAISDAVKVAVELDPNLTDPIRYPLVLLKRGSDNSAATSLFEYLGGPEAANAFRKFGFTVLSNAQQ